MSSSIRLPLAREIPKANPLLLLRERNPASERKGAPALTALPKNHPRLLSWYPTSWISSGYASRRITGRVHGKAVYHQPPRCSCGSPYNLAATPNEPPFHRVNTSPRRRAVAARMRLTRKRSRSDSGSDRKKSLSPEFRDVPIIHVFLQDENAIGYSGTTIEISDNEPPDGSEGCVSRSLFQDGAVLSHREGIPARRSNSLACASRAAEREISAQAEVINHLTAAEAAATQKQRRKSQLNVWNFNGSFKLMLLLQLGIEHVKTSNILT
ncbi:hypothetical protein G5I_03959 [Acromyrmex echinatior]|uniref:Uncharacterized protein n=1 Tax=Acromyrmex echinatior TaxID=103372 RepID=F4WEC6_ACREC|nr:hypothetical protein G5I_03959 [Acromyrmex echinatior]